MPKPQQTTSAPFSDLVLTWWDQAGRKDLPWQLNISPYRVWVSEIMLQQTQVATVSPYFERFMRELPTIVDLATASEDRVLHLWTGLGYYARARNLHLSAKLVYQELGGILPSELDALCELPGIGLSTAGAIRSIGFGERAAILDGNVKRVLARYHAVAGWPGRPSVLKQLWHHAEEHTPGARHANYSQAMMDLGATVCTRSKPRCDDCPVKNACRARAEDLIAELPGKKAPKILPIKSAYMLMMQRSDGLVLLVRRPPTGIWGGLWSFPEASIETDIGDHLGDYYLAPTREPNTWPVHRHTFSHYHFDILPVHVNLDSKESSKMDNRVMESDQQLWYNIAQPQEIGLAAPVVTLLASLASKGN
ncbi:MAG: A/G-specific adenine glycosylase [Halieaceae bacterium]